MSKFVGKWLVKAGDVAPVRALSIDITNDAGVAWQTAVGTGWTLSLEVHVEGEPSVFATISGAWQNGSDLTNPTAEFTIGTATSLFPSTIGDEARYESYVVLTNGSFVERYGADDAGTPFGFSVLRAA